MSNPAQPLYDFKPQHEFFVGIDSDGCAFDSMEIKHKECFTPNTIKIWDLQAVSKYAREASEFVNLYSVWRGVNRWPALIKVFDLLREREDVIRRNVSIPQAEIIREFIAQKEFPYSNDGLKGFMDGKDHPDLERAWKWTTAVNDEVADMVHGVPPFPYVRESLEKLKAHADMMVVSSTPVRALVQEWHEHDIAKYVSVIAGQEMGKKAEVLKIGAEGKYASDHILMIGDANGDMNAARAVNALFYPINPGDEEASWKRFYEEAIDKFFDGTYAGEYEASLIAEYEAYLPETPPWQR